MAAALATNWIFVEELEANVVGFEGVNASEDDTGGQM